MMKLIALLFSRVVLFALFQAMIALILQSWQESVKYWMLVATFTNLVSIYLLIHLFEEKEKNYRQLFHFNKTTGKKDVAIFLILTVLLIPVALGPNYFISKWFWADISYPVNILFRPVPHLLSFILLFAFPVTIALAELTTYFGYVMPELKKKFDSPYVAVLLPVLFLSIQHCTLPLVFDKMFILYRGLVYLPFALFVGFAIWKRPSLLPYFVVLHGLMDMQAVIMLIVETKK